jgi:transcription elongation factor GreA-like protein
MSLRDQIAAESTIKKGPTCSVKILLKDLPAEDAKALREAMADERVPGTAIERALFKEGHRLAAHVIQRHRRGMCSCEPV